MAVSRHTRKGFVRKHVKRTSGVVVNGKHSGTPKRFKSQLFQR